MYAFFFDKTALDSKAVIDHVTSWKQQNSIAGQDFSVESLNEIPKIISDNVNKFTTLVAIGAQDCFETLISQARNFTQNAVVAYIPTSQNALSKRLSIKDYKDGCRVISQRRIIEFNALSVNQEFFIFSYTLQTQRDKNAFESSKVHINADKDLELQLETTKIVLHNRTLEPQSKGSALLLEAFNTNPDLNSQESSVFDKLQNTINKSHNDNLELRLPANKFVIESSKSLYNQQSKSLRLPITVGAKSQKIRIIIKKGQQVQNISSTGLLS